MQCGWTYGARALEPGALDAQSDVMCAANTIFWKTSRAMSSADPVNITLPVAGS